MSLKKLAAGSGYAYLTEQVAAYDSTELGRTALADYYATKGESPGLWVGSGLVGIKGIEHGDRVSAEQMKRLFGEGSDPVAGTALGKPYREGSVAGFDLTFSPVKSVSALWAIAPPEIASAVREAHDAAVADALGFLEGHGLFTREGSGGARQVETRGLIAAAFTHRDSRAGDPDLHTHVAVANKVQTAQGRWLTIYGTVLYRHTVATSEAYNTALEHHLRAKLGLRFVDVPSAGGQRPVREIEGIDPALIGLWSRRRNDIENRVAELTAEFTAAHGRAPTSKESIGLAQRANLETREAKHEPRSEAEQRATWRAQATRELGSLGLDQMIATALSPTQCGMRRPDAEWLHETAAGVVAELESHRATWQSWHVYAEAQRQVRDLEVAPDQLPKLVEQLVAAVTAGTINLTPDLDPITEPAVLRRSDGVSVFRHTGADHYTSQAMLDAEQRILEAAGHTTNTAPEPIDVELALMATCLDGPVLNEGQRELVRALLSDPRQVALALAPAGAGKTTAMSVLAQVCGDLGYDPVGLAPSAAAAAVLREATGMQSETLAKLDHTLAAGLDPGFGPRTVVIIDEAGMADTPTLDRVITACLEHGARVRLIGDDQQLAAVGAGGVLRDIATTHGAVRLDEVVRFDDPVEAQASLDLREGDNAALGYYLDHDRIHSADQLTSMLEVLTAWQSEQEASRDCLMLAPTRDLVARLNGAARHARLDGTKPGRAVALADGNHASPGDTILTRHNDRRLRLSGTDWVKNGDRWTVDAIGNDGSIHAHHLRSGLRVVLPPDYVSAHAELGYATTVHAAQGQTADVMHGILTGTEDRQLLYTMLTRGRNENHLHVVIDQERTNQEEQFLPRIDEQLTAVETLDRIVARDGAAVSATTTQTTHVEPAAQLHDAAARYNDAVRLTATRSLGAEAAGALEAAGPGPLPWLPGIPAELRHRPEWSAYLAARAERLTQLLDRMPHDLPASLGRYEDMLTPELRDKISVWRAANGIPNDEPSLLGPRVTDLTADRYARHLQREIDALYPPAVRHWEDRIAELIGQPDHRDSHTLDLARELDRIHRDGMNAEHLLRRATAMRKPLPNEHTVEALTYRIRQMARSHQQFDPTSRHAPTQRPGPGTGLGL